MSRHPSLVALLVAAGLALASLAAASSLYWLDTQYAHPTLHRCKPDGTGDTTVALAAGTLPEGLAIDLIHSRLSWSDAAWQGAALHTTALDFAFPAAVLAGASCVRGLAVDGAGGELYWTTSNLLTGSALRRAGLDGSNPQFLVGLGASANPRGVALDLPHGHVYWTDLAQNTIWSANLDGTASAPFASLGPGTGPFGIAIDSGSGLLYWTEYAAGRIRRTPVGGGAITTLVSGLGNPAYLALDPVSGRMFWSEAAAGAQRIQRANLDGTLVQNLALPATAYGGLAFAPATALAVDGEPPVTAFALAAVSPNPVRGSARLAYALPRAARVRVSVIDVQGREVAVLADGVAAAGRHATSWSGSAPGVYFARLQADGRTWTQRFTLVR